MKRASLLFLACPLMGAICAHGASCVTESRCADASPGSARIINGVSVTRPCWVFEEVTTCQEDAESSCGGLASETACEIKERSCLKKDSAGGCVQESLSFLCEKALPGTAPVRTETLQRPYFDESACPEASLKNCAENKRTCAEERNGECVKLEISFTCEEKDASCEVLKNLGCALAGEGLYRCPEELAPPEGASKEVRESFRPEIISDTCGPFEKDGGCALSSSSCEEKEGGDCLKETRTYLCGAAEASACEALKEKNCVLEAEACLEEKEGACVKKSSTYACQAQLPSEGGLSEAGRKEVETGLAETSDCGDTASCGLISETCLEGPGEKTIAGESVYKDCWKKRLTYRCSEGEAFDDCVQFKRDAGCEFSSGRCIEEKDGACLYETSVYACKEREEKTVLTTSCETKTCTAGACVTAEAGAPGKSLEEAALRLEIGREAGVYGEFGENIFFKGALSECRRRKIGADCCKMGVKGSAENSNLSFFTVFLMDAGKEAVKTLGSPYVHDALGGSGAGAKLIEAVYGKALDGAYSPSISYYGITAGLEGGSLSVSFSPASFYLAVASRAYLGLMSCGVSEQALAISRAEGLCGLIGSECTEYAAGRCQERTSRFCCFNSKIALEVQKASRSASGRSWGTFYAPDCGGLTHYEFMNTDLSKIDLADLVEVRGREGYEGEALLARAKSRVEKLSRSEDPYETINVPSKICGERGCL